LKSSPGTAHAEPSGFSPEPSPSAITPGKLGGLSLRKLGERVWTSLNQDDVFGRSAQLAYYFFLALFPGLIFLTAIFGLLASPGTRLHDSLLRYMAAGLPHSVYELVHQTLEQNAQASGGGKLTFGILGTLWSATAGMSAVQDALNAVHKVKESRPFWRARAVALALTLVGSVLVIVAMALLLYGRELAALAGHYIGIAPVVKWMWEFVQWPVAFLFLSFTFALIYHYAPNVQQRRWEWLTPGSLVGMTAWVLASVALRVYLHYFHSFSATYGSLGAVIILLIWFYVTGMMLLLGAEINAVIKNAAAESG
jgi:membrane protein